MNLYRELCILIISTAIYFQSFSQTEFIASDCNGGLNIKTRFYEKYPFNNYKDFVKNYFNKEDQKYFSKKNDLIQIPITYNIDNKLGFTYKDIEIYIWLKDTMVQDTYNMDYFYNLPPIRYYGDIFAGKCKILDTIYFSSKNENHRRIDLPKSMHHDLLNINANQAFQSYRPIELFFDKKNNWLCIYISGKLTFEEYEHDALIGQSYIAKFIFDIKSKKYKRIIIPSSFAFSYGWLYCDNFWPF